MRKINLKKFQKNLYKEIRNLPVTVVRKTSQWDKEGVPVFTVTPTEEHEKYYPKTSPGL